MKKYFILFLLFLGLAQINIFADNLVVELKFPQASNQRVLPPKPIVPAIEISSSIDLDISPYPAVIEKGRYLVEYFLDDVLIYSSDGFIENAPLSFKCTLDTTKFIDGEHKIIVNYWDKQAPGAIGIRNVVIKNSEINE